MALRSERSETITRLRSCTHFLNLPLPHAPAKQPPLLEFDKPQFPAGVRTNQKKRMARILPRGEGRARLIDLVRGERTWKRGWW
jgi:hypothetical protein